MMAALTHNPELKSCRINVIPSLEASAGIAETVQQVIEHNHELSRLCRALASLARAHPDNGFRSLTAIRFRRMIFDFFLRPCCPLPQSCVRVWALLGSGA